MFSIENSTPAAYPQIIDRLNESDGQASRFGGTKEELTVIVRSQNPRLRWMFRPNINWAFGLQESFAYWRGKNPGHVQRYNSKMEDFMYQNEDEEEPKLHGSAYGRYLRHIPHDQVSRALAQLKENEDTRRAVINIHQAGIEDYGKGDVACTVYLQFIARDGELNCIACLRSQDMLWGYPYDTQAFQWIQEMMAGVLGLDLGFYEHRMNSCHYYTDREEEVLTSAEECTYRELPDCRLREYDVQEVMQTLDRGLRKARSGEIPQFVMSDLPEFYEDWLRFMTVYEQARLHDNENEAWEFASSIQNNVLFQTANRLFDPS